MNHSPDNWRAARSLVTARQIALTLAALAVLSGSPMSARSVSSGSPLPPATGRVVSVSTEPQLRSAVASISSNTTIVIAAGTYALTSPLWINGSFSNVTIRGASDAADDVVLLGKGMAAVSDGGVPYGIWVGGNVRDVTIANLTIRDVYQHAIVFNAGTQSPRVYGVRLIDAGEQFIKANPDGTGGGVDNGSVEFSTIEYTHTAKGSYTNGIDVHTGRDWVVHHNLFRNIRAPQGQLAGPAVLMWNGSSGTIVEGNTFINCQREVALGLTTRQPFDHSGGAVLNNFIYRPASSGGDTAIGVFQSPNSIVAHNSILLSDGYSNPIEYRFAATVGVVIANNLVNGNIAARDGARATVIGNLSSATSSLFVNPAAGDLHLKSVATAAINRGVSFDLSQDWDGMRRPADGMSDIGADEYDTDSFAPSPPSNVRILQ